MHQVYFKKESLDVETLQVTSDFFLADGSFERIAGAFIPS